MTVPTLTNLPSAPNRLDSPATFSSDVDAFLSGMVTLQTEWNASATQFNAEILQFNTDFATTVAELESLILSAENAAQVVNFDGNYNAGTTYAAGRTVLYSGLYYVSLQAGNTGNTPASSPAWWAALLIKTLPTVALGSGWNIDCNAGVDFTKTVASTDAFTISNVPASGVYTFVLEIAYTSGTITFFSGYTVKWPESLSGLQPTFAGGNKYKLAFEIRGGTTVIDVLSVQGYA